MADVITRFKVETAEYDRKIGQSKKKLDDFGKSGSKAGEALKAFSSKMGMSIGPLTAMTAGVAAAAAALNVAKDAFLSSESNIDEWGRTVESAKGAYQTFLNTINGGNWSNFFNNLKSSITSARQLYDALDRLGSVKANNKAAIAIQESALAKLRLAREGETDPTKRAALDKQIQATSGQIASLKGQGVNAGYTAGRMQIENEIRSAYNTQNAGALRASSLRQVVNSILTKGQGAFDEQAEIYQRLSKRNDLNSEEQKQLALAKAVTEAETRLQVGIDTWASAAQEGSAITLQQLRTMRQTKETGGGGGAGGGGGITIDKPWAKLKGKYTDSMKSLGTISGGSVSAGVAAVTGGIDTTNLEKQWSDLQRLSNIAAMAKENAEGAANAFTQIGAALTSIKDPGAKVLGIVSMAIANVALAFSKSIGSSLTVWDYIAGAAAGIATMYTTIDAIKEATSGSYASGGIIPGNTYSGDMQVANVNAGELILNRAQQGNLASQLTTNAEQRQMQPYLNAEMIYLGMNNYLRRTGRGEIVTTR